ncbi:hypothetical protein [Bradyrhizobium sp. JYMT SZCCT0428]|uniref:hypothetical protein n=1 Tax=Bradyrhizobium sp. JYMT SZCCT0428 TaxID=2807673 RepID=UPI001BAC63EC|nr:hypothetical protein [Bradyrhizobium sp. JYMT SZCCT0428]
MWKVKRMNTARIVVLTIAIGAGGTYPASGSDHQPAAPEPAAQLQTVDIPVAKGDIGPGQPLKPVDMQRQSGTLTLALRSIADINMVKNKTDDQLNRRGESISAVRYGVASQQSVQT